MFWTLTTALYRGCGVPCNTILILVSLLLVLENLLGKEHVIGGQTLCVRKFAFSKTDLLLKGLTDDISDEVLRYFIEAKLVPDFKLVMNEDRTRALIQADKPIGIVAKMSYKKNKQIKICLS